jgi:hypothetical protein
MFAIEEAIRSGLPEKDGALDETKFCEVVMVEAKRLGKIIAPGGAAIKGLGAATEVKEAKGKKCPDCDGDGTDDDGEDCSSCGGTGMKKMKESAAPDTDKQLASLLSETLGLSESAAGRAAKGRG